MDKKELTEQFINIFNKYLHIASFYTKDHPLFSKAVGDFKKEIDPLCMSLGRLRIGITSNALRVEDTDYTKPQYQELAKKLHVRRIKAIELKQGVTSMELSLLLTIVSVPAKELRQAGGLARFLTKTQMAHLAIEELDYSELLKSNTGEYMDIWTYLLNDVVENKDDHQTNELADGFDKMTGHFSLKEFLENNELRDNIRQFLLHLKERGKAQFIPCLRAMTRNLARSHTGVSSPDMATIKAFFDDFDTQDIAGVLIDDITNSKEVDTFSFQLFSKIIEPPKHAQIATHVEKSLSGASFENKHKIISRMRDIFSIPDISPAVSEIYRNTLSIYLKNISFEKVIALDRGHAEANYRLLLLNILEQNKNADSLTSIIAAILEEFKKVSQSADFTYVKLLMELIQHKKTEAPQLAAFFTALEKEVLLFIENNIWNEQFPAQLYYLTDFLETSSQGINVFMDKIFNKRRFNPLIMRLFLRFFPASLPEFYSGLDTKYSDMEFMENMLAGLQSVDTPLALEVLQHMYMFSNNYVKSEVLRRMKKMETFDGKFLLSVLEGADAFLKGEVLRVVERDEAIQKQAFELLFFMKNPWGIKNSVILENIAVVEELGLQQSRGYLAVLSSRFSFWNWSVKRKAQMVLRKWNL